MENRQASRGSVPGMRILGELAPGYADILSEDALCVAATLQRKFDAERKRLLGLRRARQDRLDAGEMPDFLAETEAVRRGNWQVRPAPPDLQDRRVEITGPVDRKMVINALNSGANVFMADFEDSLSPTWANLIDGQIALRDAVAGTLRFVDPESGKEYRLAEKTATLIVRPRGWHLDEAHVTVDDTPMSGGLFDFALYLSHNAAALRAKGSGPYFYLPKLESHLEARLWASVFAEAEKLLDLESGTIRATVLIETILAAFEMEEILYELREYVTGLNCGRWDYIFSYIKKFRERPDFLLPDRAQVTMTVPFLRAYAQLLIKTCHRRGAHAMGGMAAYIPVRSDAAANQTAMAAVRADKAREATDGHDGTWVAHPGLIEIARAVFDEHMPGANQLDRLRGDVNVRAADLLAVPTGSITEAGLRNNIRVGIQYIEAWLRGLGCVPLYNLMEDAATAEICRAQIWQWIRHAARLDDGRTIDAALLSALVDDEMAQLRPAEEGEDGADRRFEDAVALFLNVATAPDFVEFLTLPAYQRITGRVG